MKQILCLSYLPWQARPNRTQQLLARLTDTQVLFFEPPVPRGRPQPEQGRRMRSHITVYTLPCPLLPSLDRPMLQRRNRNRAADFVQRTMARHHFREPVLWCTSPEQAIFLDHIAYSGLVYDCHREWGEEFVDQESDLVCHAEVVFAASVGLAQRLAPCSDNIALVPNGVNHLMFTRGDLIVPPRLSALGRSPILGRLGDLNGKVELEPLLHAAKSHPDWQFVLMGRVTRPVAERLAPFPNITLTGSINAVEVPDYLNACNVLFDLIRTDRRGCDIIPPRIYEYLASGKPIVMMAEPDLVEPFPDVVYTAFDASGFVRRCRRALDEESSMAGPRRQEYARHASWANRAAEVSRILESTGLF